MLKNALGLLASPWVYTAARATNIKWLAELAAKLDPQSLRVINLIQLPRQQLDAIQILQMAAKLVLEFSPSDGQKVLKLISDTRSQFLQDAIGLIISGEKRNGFFVEVGVGDGEKLSNTVLMERKYGWEGLLCEPNHTFHESIINCRTATLDKRAIYKTSTEYLDFLAVDGVGELSQLIASDGIDKHKRSGTVYKVPTVTLDRALEEANAPRQIDFLSIDTEGSELAVLEGFDLNRWDVGMVVIEHNFDRSRRKKYSEFFRPHGYVQIFKSISLIDDWFVRKEYAPEFINSLRSSSS